MLSNILKWMVFAFFLIVPTVIAGEKLEVIPLNNRQVEEVIPVIRALLGRNETVTGISNQLIVRASPQKLKEIKSLLEKIDARLKNLRITVRQGLRSQLESLDREIDLQVPLGEAGQIIIDSGNLGSDGVILEGDSGVVRGRLQHRKSTLDEMNTQIVTTLEGNAATLYLTQQIPFRDTTNVRVGSQIKQFESTKFKQVRTGFRVLPRLQGGQVTLEISPQQSRLVNGEIETVGINTVLRGRVGEWIELGGLDQDNLEHSSGLLRSNASGKTEKRGIFIKVEEE